MTTNEQLVKLSLKNSLSRKLLQSVMTVSETESDDEI